MQSLFEGSDESPKLEGLGIIPGRVTRFNSIGENGLSVRVPQMGWNGVSPVRESVVLENTKAEDTVRNEIIIRVSCLVFRQDSLIVIFRRSLPKICLEI